MEEMKEKYAEIILKVCLKLNKDMPLFICANTEILDFVKIITKKAYEIGVTDIYYDITDPYIKREALNSLSLEDLKKHQYFNKDIWNEYAKKGTAFLMLAAEIPGLMKGIDSKKLSDITIYSLNTRKEFDDLRSKNLVPWCICAVPTESWAREVFKESDNPLEDLWHAIFKMCLIDQNNPEKLWEEKLNKLEMRSSKLNKYQFKKLHYINSLGTDFTIELPLNHLWASGCEKINGQDILVNFPTEEVFTSPDNMSINGIVYASKPLSYQDNIIKDFYFRFKDGRVIDFDAKEGKDTLENIINSCNNADRLGEVALVEYDSPISKSNILFYETLYDENASCHLALGDSFPECIKDGLNISKEDLEKKYHLNNCTNHVDFMIGTKDLKISGITKDNKEILIFKDGNFTDEFK